MVAEHPRRNQSSRAQAARASELVGAQLDPLALQQPLVQEEGPPLPQEPVVLVLVVNLAADAALMTI